MICHNGHMALNNIVEVITQQLDKSEHGVIGVNIPYGHNSFTTEGFISFIKQHSDSGPYLDIRGPFAPKFKTFGNVNPSRTVVYIGKGDSAEKLLRKAIEEGAKPNQMFYKAFSNIPVFHLAKQYVLVSDT